MHTRSSGWKDTAVPVVEIPLFRILTVTPEANWGRSDSMTRVPVSRVEPLVEGGTDLGILPFHNPYLISRSV